MRKWYDEEYRFEIEVVGFLRGDKTEALLQLGGGKTLTIKTQNQGEKNIYVKSVKLNGAALEGSAFTHDKIADGGTLEFVMAAVP